MICLVYLSSAETLLNDADLESIIDVSRRNNAAAAVTGLLCHYDGSFLQFLEGSPDAVGQTFARIHRDPRHRQILQVYRTDIAQRAFGDWTMGLVRPDALTEQARTFCQQLRAIELEANAEHSSAIEGFLQSFKAWLR